MPEADSGGKPFGGGMYTGVGRGIYTGVGGGAYAGVDGGMYMGADSGVMGVMGVGPREVIDF